MANEAVIKMKRGECGHVAATERRGCRSCERASTVIHYASDAKRVYEDGGVTSICGLRVRTALKITEDIRKTTCKRCVSAMMPYQRTALLEESISAAIESVAERKALNNLRTWIDADTVIERAEPCLT